MNLAIILVWYVTKMIIYIKPDCQVFMERVQNIISDQPEKTVYYNDIQIVPQSSAEIEISPYSSDTNLQFDINGTGNHVAIPANSVLSEDELEDYTKPTTTIFIVGTVGGNGWYVSTTSISLSATDDNSGILRIEYSLDNGAVWQPYSAPFVISEQGISTVLYKSIDRAGNKGEVGQAIIYIDTESPEAIIVFDPDKKDIVISGEDNLTPVGIYDLGSRVTLIDEAGNSTTLNFVEKNRKWSYTTALKSILYNGVELEKITKNRFNFKWKYKHDNLTELEQSILLKDVFRLRAEYNLKKNITYIRGKDAETGKIKEKMDGLVLVKIKTSKGSLNYNY